MALDPYEPRNPSRAASMPRSLRDGLSGEPLSGCDCHSDHCCCLLDWRHRELQRRQGTGGIIDSDHRHCTDHGLRLVWRLLVSCSSTAGRTAPILPSFSRMRCCSMRRVPAVYSLLSWHTRRFPAKRVVHVLDCTRSPLEGIRPRLFRLCFDWSPTRPSAPNPACYGRGGDCRPAASSLFQANLTLRTGHQMGHHTPFVCGSENHEGILIYHSCQLPSVSREYSKETFTAIRMKSSFIQVNSAKTVA